MTQWYRELELVRIGQELERLGREGEFSRWLCGREAVERLFGPIETLRASGRSLEVVAAELCDLGFRVAGSTLGAALRAIRARMEADLERVFSELDVTEFQSDGPQAVPPNAVTGQPTPTGASLDSNFDDWIRPAGL